MMTETPSKILVNQDRSVILDRIMDLKEVDGFDQQTERWAFCYLFLSKSVMFLRTKEECHKTFGIHISKATREDFETLSPRALVDALLKMSYNSI